MHFERAIWSHCFCYPLLSIIYLNKYILLFLNNPIFNTESLLLQELLFPINELGESLKSLALWDESWKSLAFCLIFSFIIYRWNLYLFYFHLSWCLGGERETEKVSECVLIFLFPAEFRLYELQEMVWLCNGLDAYVIFSFCDAYKMV